MSRPSPMYARRASSVSPVKGTSRSPSSPGQTFTESVRKSMSRMWIFKSSPVRRPVERRRDRIARSRRERRSSPVTAERRAFCSLSVRGGRASLFAASLPTFSPERFSEGPSASFPSATRDAKKPCRQETTRRIPLFDARCF